MKFVVSSSSLLFHLQAVGRVISSKNTISILENFLFNPNVVLIIGNDNESFGYNYF